MLLSCGDALVDFLPVTSVDGRDAIVPVVCTENLNASVVVMKSAQDGA